MQNYPLRVAGYFDKAPSYHKYYIVKMAASGFETTVLPKTRTPRTAENYVFTKPPHPTY